MIQETEPLLQWSDPAKELIGFLGLFLSAGGIGFRFAALRGWEIETDKPFYDDAARRAAWLGLIGVVLSLLLVAIELPASASRKHLAVGAFIASDTATLLEIILLGVAALGYLMAAMRVGAGWYFAAAGVIFAALRLAFLGQWSRLVNPVHSLAAALWIGTLFVLVVAGLAALLRHEPTRERRGAIAADMVNGFSPLALTMGMIVVVFGLITAWRHLHVLSNLWSTPYGYTLIAKLVLVGIVFALGAWNWRRQRPTLGTAEAATSIRSSATMELVFATLVLLVTAVLVSLPAPKG